MALNVVICGGGIAGLTLARFLAAKDHAVTLVEKQETWSPAGAGIVLSVNATRVLDRLGCLEELEAVGYPLDRLLLTDAAGSVLSAGELRELRELGPTVALHRADLHEVLSRRLEGVDVRLGSTVESADLSEPKPRVTLADGTQVDADLVVGADGVGSRIRSLLFEPGRSRYAGYTCWRFVTERTHGIVDAVEMWGAGKRFGVVPLGPRGVYCYATVNAPPRSAAVSVDDFRDLFADFGVPASLILERLASDTVLIHDDLGELRQRSWYHSRVVLIGDAAHAMTPNMGQGAAMAIEDAAVLAEELHDASKDQLAAALARYEERRRPRVEWIQRQSWRIGAVGQWHRPFSSKLRNRLVRWVPDGASLGALRRLLKQPI